MTDTAIDEAEARRIALAKRAALLDKHQADAKAFNERLKAREDAEVKRQAAYLEETKRLYHERDVIRNRVKQAGDADNELRRMFVAVDVRERVKATERATRAAQRVLADTQAHLRGEQRQIEELRHRVKTVPSGAAPKDLMAEIERMIKALAPAEAREAQARETLAAAQRDESSAKADYDVAMRAARAL